MKQCAFCPNTKLTGEHVWSSWIVELLEPVTKGFKFRYRDTDTGVVRHWHSSTMDQLTNQVCGPCSNGWMSDIESATKETFSGVIRDGAQLSMLPRGSVALAEFAFKCAVIANYMSPYGAPFFSTHIRHTFKESRRIPDGVEMWIAAFQGAHRYSGRFVAYYATSHDPMGKFDLQFFIFTFVVGHLAFQLAAPKWEKLHRAGPKFPKILPDAIWDTATFQFWPIDGFPVSWPPRHYLDDEGLDAFTNRFSQSVRLSLL
jgi:hypothetical protein